VRGNPLVVQLQERGANLDDIEDAVTRGLADLGGDAPLRISTQTILVHGQR
jgi:hypothetical protein